MNLKMHFKNTSKKNKLKKFVIIFIGIILLFISNNIMLLIQKEIEPYNVINKSEPIPTKSYIDENFIKFKTSDNDLNNISAKTYEINETKKVLLSKYQELCEIAYKGIVDNYNILTNAYNNLIPTTSIDFLKDIPKQATLKNISDLILY